MDRTTFKAIDPSALPRQQLRQSSANECLVSLNFKVPVQIRHQFKVYAASHDLTMTELLLQLVNDRLRAGVSSSDIDTSRAILVVDSPTQTTPDSCCATLHGSDAGIEAGARLRYHRQGQP